MTLMNLYTVDHWYVSKFPISGSAGVHYLTDLVRHGTAEEPAPKSCHVFFNASKTVAMLLVIDAKGETRIPIRVCPVQRGETFVVPAKLRGWRTSAFAELPEQAACTMLQIRVPKKGKTA